MKGTAEGIAEMLMSSRAASPFVVAVDAGWGMGKSTLLRQVQAHLEAQDEGARFKTVWFNAWTAEGGNALEGLIKSVLEELDSNIVRRWVRKAARRRRLLGIAWIGFALASRFLGVARLVDELWKQLALDAQSRNKLRDDIRGMLSEWVKRPGRLGADRCMVVFIDDLDRCSDDVVVKVCEAVKLYLDAPGLIFVLACDESVLARGLASPARGGTAEGRSYLEKIVQVVYRVPPPDDDGVRDLIRGYAAKSRTGDLIRDQVAATLAESTGRNPRQIKRIINSFILEHQLSPAWRSAPLSSTHLITAILLQHLYTPFYNLIVQDGSGPDPIGELLEYAQIRASAGRGGPDPGWEDSFGALAAPFFAEHNVPRRMNETETASEAVKRLEQKLPEEFPRLAEDEALISLLHGLGDEQARRALRRQLFRHPLVTESPELTAPPSLLQSTSFERRRFVSVDDHPENNAMLIAKLEDLGADVTPFSDEALGERVILRTHPDAVISDIARGSDNEAGFTAAQRLRDEGYAGPIVFFTARVTPERRERAAKLGAVVVAREIDVIRALGNALQNNFR
jgi:CheY-like chemotaxis protein